MQIFVLSFEKQQSEGRPVPNLIFTKERTSEPPFSPKYELKNPYVLFDFLKYKKNINTRLNFSNLNDGYF
jgi:hypothetical protein